MSSPQMDKAFVARVLAQATGQLEYCDPVAFEAQMATEHSSESLDAWIWRAAHKLDSQHVDDAALGDVEYGVSQEWGSFEQDGIATWQEACALAIGRGASNGEPVTLDIMASSQAGADSIGLGELHRQSPDASVTQRMTITVNPGMPVS